MTTADLAHARALADLRRYVEAEQVLRILLAQNADDAEVMRVLSDVVGQLGRTLEHVKLARRAAALEPENVYGLQVLCDALIDNDDFADALKVAQRAVQLAPHLWTTHYTLGRVLLRRTPARLEDALDAANEAVRLAPYAADAHNLAGMCLNALDLTDSAVKAYSEALRLDPHHALAMNNLAALRINQGSLSLGSRFLTSGLAVAPQESILHRNYDHLLVKLTLRLYLPLIAAGFILALLAAPGVKAPYYLRVLTTVLLLAAYTTAVSYVTRHLPRGAHLWVRGLFRRLDWPRRVIVVVFVLLTAGVFAMGVGTRDLALDVGRLALGVLQVGFALLWISGIARFIGGVGRRIWR